MNEKQACSVFVRGLPFFEAVAALLVGFFFWRDFFFNCGEWGAGVFSVPPFSFMFLFTFSIFHFPVLLVRRGSGGGESLMEGAGCRVRGVLGE